MNIRHSKSVTTLWAKDLILLDFDSHATFSQRIIYEWKPSAILSHLSRVYSMAAGRSFDECDFY